MLFLCYFLYRITGIKLDRLVLLQLKKVRGLVRSLDSGGTSPSIVAAASAVKGCLVFLLICLLSFLYYVCIPPYPSLTSSKVLDSNKRLQEGRIEDIGHTTQNPWRGWRTVDFR